MTQKFILNGTQLDNDSRGIEGYTAYKTIETSVTRASGHEIAVDADPDDIVEIELEDGTFWMGRCAELPKLYEEYGAIRGKISETFILSPVIPAVSQDRSGVGGVIAKIFRFLKPQKAIVGAVVKRTAKKVDEQIVPRPGLYQVSHQFETKPVTGKFDPEQTYLLFIHGTASSFDAAFGKIFSNQSPGLWEHITRTYGDRILAFDHHTLSRSPFENATDLITHLPSTIKLHIISHSRGGLVGDILCRYHDLNDQRGYSDELWARLLKDYDTDMMHGLKSAAQKKKLIIEKFVRVACTSHGTTLLTKRLDHYLNALINGILLLTGGASAPLVQVLKTLLADVLACKEDDYALPGLEAQVPDSAFQVVHNSPVQMIKAPLTIVGGNAKAEWSKRGFITILSKFFYWHNNDWIVDTKYMLRGTRRLAPVGVLIDEGPDVNHFNYFLNARTQAAIRIALASASDKIPEGFTSYTPEDIDAYNRGILMGSFFQDEVTGSKPVVIILPGILGSNLSADNEEIYLNFGKLVTGGMKKLAIGNDGISARSIIGDAYRSLARHLEQTHDVVTFPYDWRLSVELEAKRLNDRILALSQQAPGQPVKLIAHSMGGVLARHFIIRYPETWDSIQSHPDFKLLFLGTPLGGSYLIPEVLIGEGKRIRQMASIDVTNSIEDLLSLFTSYRGILNLLPIATTPHDFGNKTLWKTMKENSPKNDWPMLDDKDLDDFNKFRKDVLAMSADIYQHRNVIYVAGKADSTTESFYYDETVRGKNRLTFTFTDRGDGSVTWASGIPKEFEDSDRLYYVNSKHGSLAKDQSLFQGLSELLRDGKTTRFSNKPVATEKGFFSRILNRGELQEPTALNLARVMMDAEEDTSVLTLAFATTPIEVTLSCGDFYHAQFPVMLGHLANDAILGAEGVLDRNLNRMLSHKLALGLYPQTIGSSEIFQVDGLVQAVVLGLGKAEELSGYNLEQSVKQGIIKYLLKLHENPSANKDENRRKGLTILLIGSGYGGMSIESGIKAIISGAQKANEAVRGIGMTDLMLDTIEFIELYEDKALQAFYALKKIKRNSGYNYMMPEANIRYLFGRKKRILLDHNTDWFQRITIVRKEGWQHGDSEHEIHFTTNSSIARAEQYVLPLSPNIIDNLVKGISVDNRFSPEVSKTLFELLIPNEFKDEMQNQQNLLLLLDEHTAAYPWELLQDTKYHKEPISVQVNMIRQLASANFRRDVNYYTGSKALVIGDPELDKFMMQLGGAREEATATREQLKGGGFVVEDSIGNNSSDILIKLFRSEYKVIHLAGHGVFDAARPSAGGMVIGRDTYLSTKEISKLPYVPELVFVNCCYLGTTSATAEQQVQERYKMAANIGTELIQMGVKAVVVAGWAIDDKAALLFSRVFYAEMLAGATFAEAVQQARRECYDQYHHISNTWGAYQCYGNYSYRLSDQQRKTAGKKEYLVDEEIEIDLINLLNDGDNKFHQEANSSKLITIEEVLRERSCQDAGLYELLANCYFVYKQEENALRVFSHMKQLPRATFSVKALHLFALVRRKLLQRAPGTNEKTLEELHAVIEDMKHILIIGRTAERYDMLAGTYKTEVLFRIRLNKPYSEALKQAISHYRTSYEITKSNKGNTIYPLTNALVLEHAQTLKAKKPSTKTAAKKPATARNHQAAMLKLLEEEYEFSMQNRSNELDFWDIMIPSNRYLCEAVMGASDEKLELFRAAVTRAWKQAGSANNKAIEYDQVEFLSTLFAFDKKTSVIVQKALKILKDL